MVLPKLKFAADVKCRWWNFRFIYDFKDFSGAIIETINQNRCWALVTASRLPIPVPTLSFQLQLHDFPLPIYFSQWKFINDHSRNNNMTIRILFNFLINRGTNIRRHMAAKFLPLRWQLATLHELFDPCYLESRTIYVSLQFNLWPYLMLH